MVPSPYLIASLLQLTNQLTYLGSNILSVKSDVMANLYRNHSNKIKQEFFQSVTMSGEKFYGNYTRMLHAVLNKSKKQKSQNNCTVTYLPSYKQYKYNKQDLLGTAEEVRIIS